MLIFDIDAHHERMQALTGRLADTANGEDLLDVATACACMITFALAQRFESEDQRQAALSRLMNWMCDDLGMINRVRIGPGEPAPMVELHAAPNYLGRIESIYAALSLDDGGEGVCAAPLGDSGITATLVAADKIRFDKYLRPLAQRIAKMFGKPVRIAKFTRREDVEICQP